MTKEQQQVAKLVRDLDLEKHRRIQAERQARALRMTLARLMAERRAAKQPSKPEPERPHARYWSRGTTGSTGSLLLTSARHVVASQMSRSTYANAQVEHRNDPRVGACAYGGSVVSLRLSTVTFVSVASAGPPFRYDRQL
jgi:hypothetical protein